MFDSWRGHIDMSEKIEKPDETLALLIEKARKLMDAKVKFWIQRNVANLSTGEVAPGKLEKGWQILNIDNNGSATMYRGIETFHLSAVKLENLNKDLFGLADQL